MKKVKIFSKDGDYIDTCFDGNFKEIIGYFVGRPWQFKRKFKVCVKIIIN